MTISLSSRPLASSDTLAGSTTSYTTVNQAASSGTNTVRLVAGKKAGGLGDCTRSAGRPTVNSYWAVARKVEVGSMGDAASTVSKLPQPSTNE